MIYLVFEIEAKKGTLYICGLNGAALSSQTQKLCLMRTINHIQPKRSCWASEQRIPTKCATKWPCREHLGLLHNFNYLSFVCIRLRSLSTSLISLILDPPLPISEPHWLAGNTRRSVTGGLLDTVLFTMQASMSCKRNPIKSHTSLKVISSTLQNLMASVLHRRQLIKAVEFYNVWGVTWSKR